MIDLDSTTLPAKFEGAPDAVVVVVNGEEEAEFAVEVG